MEEYLKLLQNFKAFDINNISQKQYQELKDKQCGMLYACMNRVNGLGSSYPDLTTSELLTIIQKNNEMLEKIEVYIREKLVSKRDINEDKENIKWVEENLKDNQFYNIGK